MSPFRGNKKDSKGKPKRKKNTEFSKNVRKNKNKPTNCLSMKRPRKKEFSKKKRMKDKELKPKNKKRRMNYRGKKNNKKKSNRKKKKEKKKNKDKHTRKNFAINFKLNITNNIQLNRLNLIMLIQIITNKDNEIMKKPNIVYYFNSLSVTILVRLYIC